MSTVQDLIERNRVTVDVDGMSFLCHRQSAVLAIEAFGAGCLMVVNEGTPDQRVDLDPEKAGDNFTVMQKYLAVAMIEPAFGEEDDIASGVISWRSLGDVGPRLYNKLMSTAHEDSQAFHESSEVQTE